MDKSKWTYKKLGEICSVLSGLWTGKKPPYKEVGVIRNANFTKDCQLRTDNIAIIQVEENQFKKKQLHKGDIIIEKSGGSDTQPVGRPVLFELDGEYSFSNFTSALRINDGIKLNPKFLHKCLLSYYQAGATKAMQSKTTGLHNLDMKRYISMPIPIPSFSIQQQIVSELDQLSELISLKQQQLKEYDSLEKSLFYEIFGDPILNDKLWDKVVLGEVAEFKNGLNFSPNDNGISYKFIGVGDFGDRQYLDCKHLSTYISTSDSIDASYFLNNDDIVLVRSNGSKRLVGRCMLLRIDGEKVVYSGFCIRCRIKDNRRILPIYLVSTLSNERIKAELLKEGRGANISNINQKMLSQLIINVPPLNIQESFASKVQAIEQQESLIKQSIAETQTLLDSRMQEYFG